MIFAQKFLLKDNPSSLAASKSLSQSFSSFRSMKSYLDDLPTRLRQDQNFCL